MSCNLYFLRFTEMLVNQCLDRSFLHGFAKWGFKILTRGVYSVWVEIPTNRSWYACMGGDTGHRLTSFFEVPTIATAELWCLPFQGNYNCKLEENNSVISSQLLSFFES